MASIVAGPGRCDDYCRHNPLAVWEDDGGACYTGDTDLEES